MPKEVTFAKGDIIIKEGESSGELWIIRNGTVQIYRERRGREYILGTVKEGEMLGTMTATTGLPRQASCRALTPVKATVVSKEKVSELLTTVPKWANGFIKDLVSRVQYANELYIEREVAHEHLSDSPVAFSMDVAKGAIRLAATIAIEDNERFYVARKELIEKLEDALGKPDAIKELIELFMAAGVLHEEKTGAQGRYIPVQDIEKLKFYNDMAALCIEAQASSTEFIMPLAQGERKMLSTLAQLAGSNAAEGESQILNLNDLEDKFRQRGEIEFRFSTLERAAKLSLLKLDKSASTSAVIVDTQFLDYGLKSLSVIREISTEKASPNHKKSLLY